MSQRANFDSPWKKGLEIYFRDFIAFFFPHIHNEIDWRKGYDRQDILELYRFIDWLMNLPEKLELEFRQKLQEYQLEGQMGYVSGIEKTAMQKIAVKLLTKRFGYLRPELNERILD